MVDDVFKSFDMLDVYLVDMRSERVALMKMIRFTLTIVLKCVEHIHDKHR